MFFRPPVPCPWEGCTRKLSSKVGLYNHLRMHRGEADFKCSHCGKGFFKRSMLKSHMKIHQHSVRNTTLIPTPINNHQETWAEIQMENLHIDQSQEQQVVTGVEMIQLICASCLNGFDSEENFAKHICTGQENSDSSVAAEAILGNGEQQHVIIQTAEDQETININQEDLAASLIGEVSQEEVADDQVEVPQAMDTLSHEGHFELQAVGENGETQNVSVENNLGLLMSMMQANTGQVTSVELPSGHGDISSLVVSSASQLNFTSNDTTVVTAGDMNLASPIVSSLSSSNVQHVAVADQESIVMMVSGDDEDNQQHIPMELSGDQPFTSAAVVNVPTSDGGSRVLLIPISSTDGQNTVLTLPHGITLDSDCGDVNMTVTMGAPSSDSEQAYLTLPVSDVDGLLEATSDSTSQESEVIPPPDDSGDLSN
ncbi:zinc finger protein 236-like [Limulus polyphemus]|uniref:Zinc finger protein 236-like n=1 Tax=Limulus polyphemus TaxID=6850 RepID=A0ABM1C2C6_LIMPO|nr:zinc finger protein 236-like [Limulus polyphemus]